MPKRILIIILSIFTILITACKSKECDDPLALNYNPNATTQDKYCLYSENDITEPTTLKIKFNLYSDNKLIELDKEFSDSRGKHLKIETLKFYLANMEIDKETISNIEFIDFENDTSSLFSDSLLIQIPPVESINELSFDVGVPPELNSTDPNQYDITHPLSFKYDMYWSWSSMYRFLILEGRYDANNDGIFEKTFFYHIGLDEMLRNAKIPINLSIIPNKSNLLNLYFEIDKFQYSEGFEINLNNSKDRATHTEDNRKLARRVADSFSTSIIN